MAIKIKFLISALFFCGLIAVLVYLYASNSLLCPIMGTANNFGSCDGVTMNISGVLICPENCTPSKSSIPYLNYGAGGRLPIYEWPSGIQNYINRSVIIEGTIHTCKEMEQCAGTGLGNITSIREATK